jgi:hypothetical protein
LPPIPSVVARTTYDDSGRECSSDRLTCTDPIKTRAWPTCVCTDGYKSQVSKTDTKEISLGTPSNAESDPLFEQ